MPGHRGLDYPAASKCRNFPLQPATPLRTCSCRKKKGGDQTPVLYSGVHCSGSEVAAKGPNEGSFVGSADREEGMVGGPTPRTRQLIGCGCEEREESSVSGLGV